MYVYMYTQTYIYITHIYTLNTYICIVYMNLLEWLTDCGLDSSMEAFYYNGKDMNPVSSYSVHEVG